MNQVVFAKCADCGRLAIAPVKEDDVGMLHVMPLDREILIEHSACDLIKLFIAFSRVAWSKSKLRIPVVVG